MAQSFGGPWTLLKLEILEKYLGFYTKALSGKFKLCYIDAFAGSGNVNIRDYGMIFGSALRALDYNFDHYFYIEKMEPYLRQLEENINRRNLDKNITIINGDCNELIHTITSYDWFKNGWRGVIFLDPYAMELDWESLTFIARTKAFDVWYLFPISALVRNLPKNGKISINAKLHITRLLGTEEWERHIYVESPQISLFDESPMERISFDGIKTYVINRLKSIFPGVSQHSKLLTLPNNNAPLFLLCFAVSNPSSKAIDLSLKVADHTLLHTD